MTTNDIDKIVHDFIIKHNAYPTPIGFMGFPKSVCTSVNEGIYNNIYLILLFLIIVVVCHGIPNERPLENGDWINLDITLYKDGVHGDTSVMGCIGEVDKEIIDLINATQFMLYESIKICKPGEKINKIGKLCRCYKLIGSYIYWNN